MCVSGIGRLFPPALIALAATGTCVSAGTLYVDGSAAPGGDGLSWSSAFQQLEQALSSAKGLGATEIWVREGTYVPANPATSDPRSRQFLLPSGVAVLGGFAGDETLAAEREIELHPTILSGDLNGDDLPGFSQRGDNSYHVVAAPPNAVVVLDGLVIRGGYASGSPNALRRGAGVALSGGTVTIRDCRVTDNWAYDLGGGVFCSGGNIVVSDCLFVTNRVGPPISPGTNGGGGLCLEEPIAADVRTSQFYANVSEGGQGFGSGAAIRSPVGTVTVASCEFLQNVSPSGGLFIYQSSQPAALTEIADCSFVGNGPTSFLQGSGGGLYFESSPFSNAQATISGCSFRSNFCGSVGGGGARVHYVTTTFEDCEFLDNASDGEGGGLLATNRSVTLANSLFEGNSCATRGGGCSGEFASIANCVFRANACEEDGGALYLASVFAGVVIKDSQFEGNWAQALGGAVATAAKLTVERSRIVGNYAWQRGGAIETHSSDVSVIDSLVATNQSPSGAGLAVGVGSLLVRRTTIANNSADGPGSGIWKSASTLTVTNSIVWGNTSAGLGGLDAQIEVTPTGGSAAALSLGWSDVEGGEALGGSVIASSPLFVDADGADGLMGTLDDNYGLRFDSPCINVAQPGPAGVGEVDLSGGPRRQQCRLDMGALESPYLSITSPDCNGNGIADECDIDSGVDPDCDGDGTPNSCDIANGASDCDHDGVPDSCQLAQSQGDCDSDGEFDACETLAGAEPDCNRDLVPDDCQVGPAAFAVVSPSSAPFGFGVPALYEIIAPPRPVGTVTITLKAKADLSAPDEFVTLSLNGESLGTAFVVAGDCPSLPNVAKFTLTADEWTRRIGTENAVLLAEATSTVNPGLCSTWLTIAVSYAAATQFDSDANGAIDTCEHPHDVNGDLIVDGADLALLLRDWGPCPNCPADFDNDGEIGPLDLAALLGDWS